MDIRLIDKLGELLARESQRRKKELVSLKIGENQKCNKASASRTAFVFAYAHWEGFVKNAARAYLSFATFKSKQLSSCITPFIALACRSELAKASQATAKIQPHIDIVELLTIQLNRVTK